MDSAKSTLLKHNMIATNDTVGVGVSGGVDSMALLHFLVSLQNEMQFDLVAIHIDHSIRENSQHDALFVQEYCKQNNIKFFKAKIDVPKYASQKALSIETAARECRNQVFESLMSKGIITKIALAHHISDQAETILLHLFRGSGLSGAKGMSMIRKGVKIRPLLETTKDEILTYVRQKFIPYVNDETNEDNAFARNFIRNEVLPLIKTRWPSIETSLSNFGKSCTDDSEYIKLQTNTDGFIVQDNYVKIPSFCFLLHPALVSRSIFAAFEMLGIEQDIEKKHIEMVKFLQKNAENGKKLTLPNGVQVHKEYEYITITKKAKPSAVSVWLHKTGSFEAEYFGKVTIRKTAQLTPKKGTLLLDATKVPADAIWRIRQNGDQFTKFGGGTKKLKDYFIDIKIPLRERDFIPVLASGKTIYAIAGYEISDEVRVTEQTTNALSISVKKYTAK